MPLETTALLALNLPALADVPDWAWFALGIATGVLLAPGLAAYTAARERRRRSGRRAQSRMTAREHIASLEDDLAAAESARALVEDQLGEAQHQAVARLRLLEAVADTSLPALGRLEEAVARLLDGEREEGLDRREDLGPLSRDLRALSVMLTDLMALGRIDGGEEAPRSEPVELRRVLAGAANGHPAIVLDIESDVPDLFRSDRALLSLVFDRLAALSDASSGAVQLHVGSEIMRSGLHVISLSYHGLPALPAAARAYLEAPRGEEVPVELLGGGGEALGLAVASRALARLGGGISIAAREDGRDDLLLELVLTTAPERRGVASEEEADASNVREIVFREPSENAS